jgi:hypothetical protein
MLTGRIGVEISGLVGARGGRIGLPDSLSGGVSRRAGRGDSHSEMRRTWFGARFQATTWMVGDVVTTEAPPLAGLEARRRLLARLRSTGTVAYKLATTTDHKMIGIMYLDRLFQTRHDCRGRIVLWPPCAGSGRGSLISASPSAHESLGNMVLAVLSGPGGALLLAGARR